MPNQEEPRIDTDSEKHSDPASTEANAGNPFLGRAEERVNEALRGTADRIQSAAERLGGFAGDRFSGTEGAVGRAGDLAHSLADSLERVADYFRSADFQALRAGLERSARERPLRTLFAGVAVGWVVGKLVR